MHSYDITIYYGIKIGFCFFSFSKRNFFNIGQKIVYFINSKDKEKKSQRMFPQFTVQTITRKNLIPVIEISREDHISVDPFRTVSNLTSGLGVCACKQDVCVSPSQRTIRYAFSEWNFAAVTVTAPPCVPYCT